MWLDLKPLHLPFSKSLNMLSIFYYISFVICLLGTKVLSQDIDCKQGTGFFPDPEQCDLYYICSRGKGEVKLCPDGLVFDDKNPNKERCDIPANVDCTDRPILQPAKPSKGCPRANGYYRHEDPVQCDKFFNCVDGVPHEVSCPSGLVYDDAVSTCIWPQDNHNKECTKPIRGVLDDGFSCPGDIVTGPDGQTLPHPTFAHPSDCQKFYICRNGIQPQRGSCSYGTVYNEVTFSCDDPAKVPGCEKYFDDVENSEGGN